MRIQILIILFFTAIFVSCSGKHGRKEQISLNNEIMDVTCYTGNALVFFVDGHIDFKTIYIIPILENDTNIFKRKNFDIYNAIKSQCSIFIPVNDEYLFSIQHSETKRKLDKEICNISGNYYEKIWIKYIDFKEAVSKRKRNIKKDSCEIRTVYNDGKGKFVEFKIMKDSW